MSVQDVYNFEKAIETGAANLCVSLGLTVATSQGKHVLNQDGSYSVTKLNLQRDTPRVEIIFTRGGSAGKLAIVTPGDDYVLHRQQAWIGNLDFSSVTAAKPDIHFSYVAVIRNLLATLPSQLNAVDGSGKKIFLPNHHMHHPPVDAADTHRYDPESGFFVTTSRVSFQFSILHSAWALLTTP